MKSSKKNKKAGSALLMVVGLLTILGMLGGTFLLVASLHRRASASLLAIRPLDDLAKGVASQIANELLKDLYIDKFPDPSTNRAPYVGTTGTGAGSMYADSKDADDFLDDPGAAIFPGAAQGAHVDTKGDGNPDAYLYPTGVFNANGKEIHAAVNVVDTSLGICVNTGGDNTATLSPVTPVMIGLKQLVTSARYDGQGGLHDRRCGGASKTPAQYSSECALVLSSVVAPYKPFSIEDELFLRWLKPDAATNTGRLHSALGDYADRGLLTTIARSRSILRNPTDAFRTRLMIDALDVLDDEATRNWLLDELYRLLGLNVGPVEGTATTIDDPSVTGGWYHDETSLEGYEDDYFYRENTNPGTETATWDFGGLDTGNYKVSVTWVIHSNPDNRASDAPYTIRDGTTFKETVDVNQKVDGTDFEDPTGVGWKTLGTYNITSGSLRVQLTNDADSYVCADAVRIVEMVDQDPGGDPPSLPDPFIIDDQDAGATEYTGDWYPDESYPNFHDTGYTDNGAYPDVGTTFTFTPTIPTLGTYEVYMWWPSDEWDLESEVPVDIVHLGGTDPITVDQTVDGGQWNLLGTYNFKEGTTGKVIIKTEGTYDYVVADAVRFVCTAVIEVSAPEPADHFLANLWAYLSQLDPQTNTFKIGDAYGVVPQLVITEAYAYSIKRTTTDPDPNDEGWAFAIELMNPTDVDVNASNYVLKCGGTFSWDFSAGSIGIVTPGSKIVLYAYGGKNKDDRATDAQASDFFTTGAEWQLVSVAKAIDFAEANKDSVSIKVVRIVSGAEIIPVDSVKGSDIGYSVARDAAGAVEGSSTVPDVSTGQRDDDYDWDNNTAMGRRGRALVAVMKTTALSEATKKSGHRLGQSNELDENDLGTVYEGFFLKNLGQKASPVLGTGDTQNLGKLINRYITGPTAALDFPHRLKNHMASEFRGRINHKCDIPVVEQGYPPLPWPNLLGELLELVQPHTTSSLIYGRVNINTKSEDVLAQLPWPASVVEGSVSYTVTANDINGSGNANSIVKKIIGGPSYETPGQVAAVLATWVNTNKLSGAQQSAGYIEAKYALYNAISNVITTNSDTFAVYIRTQIGPNPKAGAHYYVAVIDRSNCFDNNDRPQILMFAQIKQ